MQIKQLIKLIFINIYHNKLRAFLTTLGVIVGTATIFLVVAIGSGGEAQVNEQYSNLNVGTIMVTSAQRGRVVDPLTAADADRFSESSNITVAYPVLQGRGNIAYNNYASNSSYMAIQSAFQDINHLTIQYGRHMEEDDEKQKYVVLGFELADTLSDGYAANMVGSSININGRKFEIIGIYERKGDTGSMMAYDDTAFIGYTAGVKYLLGTRANPMIVAQATGIDTVQAAINDITSILDETHRAGGSSQFRIMDAGSRLVAAQETARTMSMLLLSVAVIVLIVSGIGIMNVMYVTVQERTKEIGVLRAIGAKKSEILRQFLIEAVIISLTGGIIGVVLGYCFMPLLSYLDLTAVYSSLGIWLGLSFSVLTGVIFGFIPALRAADLDPIEALRYE